MASKEPEKDKIRAYCEESVAHFEWLEALGFEFERSYYPEKAVIQPGTEGLMFTGNEKLWPYKDAARPAPRGHKVPVAGDTEGTKMVMDLLRDRCEEAGVEVRYETGATNLVVDDEGAVVGVAWRRFEESGHVLAGGVVLAAGGFVMNPDMVAEHTPALAQNLFTLGSTYDDGLGIRLGVSVGAELKHMDEPFITAPVYPPSRLLTGIIVNAAGERFVAEDSYHSRTSQFVMEQPGLGRLPDRRQRARGVPQVPAGAAHRRLRDAGRARDRPVAARRVGHGVAGALQRARRARRGPRLPQGRRVAGAAGHRPVGGLRPAPGQGDVRRLHPRRACGSPSTAPCSALTAPSIAGLYAAGACASNLAQDGKGYCSGTQLGEGSFFGRKAGVAAARAAGSFSA